MLRRSSNLSQFNCSNQIKADQMESSQNFFCHLNLSTKLNALIIIYPVHVFTKFEKFFEQILRRKFDQIDI